MILVAGFVVFLVALYVSAEAMDRYWRSRQRPPRPAVRQSPLFRTSHNQCADCGREGDLLNLDEICRECFDLKTLIR